MPNRGLCLVAVQETYREMTDETISAAICTNHSLGRRAEICRHLSSLCVYRSPFGSDQAVKLRKRKDRAADQGVWASEASGTTIDFSFAYTYIYIYIYIKYLDLCFYRRKATFKEAYVPRFAAILISETCHRLNFLKFHRADDSVALPLPTSSELQTFVRRSGRKAASACNEW